MDETGKLTGHKAKKNSTSFSKENPRPGPGRGKKKAKDAIGEAALGDMKRAYETAETADEPPGVKAARKLLHENYEKFMVVYARLHGGNGEVPQEDSNGGLTGSGCHPPGPKEEKVIDLAERLLREWGVSEEKALVSGFVEIHCSNSDSKTEES